MDDKAIFQVTHSCSPSILTQTLEHFKSVSQMLPLKSFFANENFDCLCKFCKNNA